MEVALLEFPGSNRDFGRTLSRVLGLENVKKYTWRDTKIGVPDVLLIPGGYSYDDALRPGALAARTPLGRLTKVAADKGSRIIGIGNGFQVLCELELLPGCLLPNPSKAFINRFLRPTVLESAVAELSSVFGTELSLPISAYQARYWADRRTLREIEERKQVVLRYSEDPASLESNPSLSAEAVAGVCSENGKIVGIMPRLERACEPGQLSTDGLKILKGLFS